MLARDYKNAGTPGSATPPMFTARRSVVSVSAMQSGAVVLQVPPRKFERMVYGQMRLGKCCGVAAVTMPLRGKTTRHA